MKDFKVSAWSCAKIMTGEVGLTEKQELKLAELLPRKNGTGKPLTPNMEAELSTLLFKQANPELPQGAKTYCETWYIQQKYGRKKEWFNKAVEKGLMVEHLGIEMLSAQQGIDLVKNEEFFSNDYIQGQPDVIHNGIVFDIKSSWDIFSFPFFEKELPNTDYWWQLQCYMAITGLTQASIVYCLINTPQPLIDQELKKLYYQSGGTATDWTPDTYKELEKNYQFNDIAESERIKDFPVEKDETAAERIKERVLMCREYIKTLEA
jgi:hypothetical protein